MGAFEFLNKKRQAFAIMTFVMTFFGKPGVTIKE